MGKVVAQGGNARIRLPMQCRSIVRLGITEATSVLKAQTPTPVPMTNEGVEDFPGTRTRGMVASPEGPDGCAPRNAGTLRLSSNHVK
jgi:hypothetical protein